MSSAPKSLAGWHPEPIEEAITRPAARAQIAGRRAAIAVAAGSLVLLLVGCVPYGNADPRLQPTVSPETSAPSVAPSPSPSPTLTSKPTPTSSAVAEQEPDAPETVVTSASAATVGVADSSSTQMSALALLETLPVKGRAPKTGYDRKAKFGTPWLDVDRNGCDTRNDILARDLESQVKSGPCKVTSGTLQDPYTGKTIIFVRGNTTSLAVQVDHVVALLNAWETGAQQLSVEQRVSLANDPINLFAVDGPTNGRKGAGDAATWLPPKKDFRCTYVARQVSVKATYGLWVTQAERDALARVLGSCPDEPGVTSSFTPPAPTAEPEPAPAADPEPEPTLEPAPPAPPAPVPTPEPAPVPDVYYQNCTAARAAGAAPIYRGEPGYAKKLDRDGDGIACE